MQIMDYVHAIEQMRTPLLNHFFIFMNLFDTTYFAMVAIPLVWVICSALWGARMTYLMALSGLMNAALKHLFSLPRPCQLDPTFCLIEPSGFGFPSGGAQTAALFGFLLFFSAKSKHWKTIAILYFALVSFSRIYLGVHYPRDVLAGWVVGGLILCLYFSVAPRLEAWFARIPPKQALLHAIWLPWLTTPLLPKAAPEFLPALSTLGIGLWISAHYKLDFPEMRSFFLVTTRALLLFCGAGLLYFAFGKIIGPPLGVLWISVGAGALWKAARLP